ncbi:citrate transporter [Gordonia sp. 852002-50816_SCH5313054-c]|uniref:SLC13 family permease n=2 Tax=Gordonia TaxID=2053 RepID=UPI0007EAD5A0|nr:MULTISPECIES: SLC13 family permease [unclassified Gordonia (in: high G+C Gram-positive bacteria)]OBC11242.1 citrate transporter [Gordonia sp. 852002-50816_SCH5313054-c]OBC14485.1 citrate transporter [Gordonia sp. 852002-50816_SCH5313054-a]
MSDAALSLIVLGVTVVLFIINKLPVGLVAIGSALALYFLGLVQLDELTSGLGQSVIAFIAALFVISEGLEASGITAWLGSVLARVAGRTRTRVVAAIMVLAAALSPLITINGAAAALVPVSVAVARRAHLSPSRVLLPLAFAASAGSLLTLSGSPVNVIIDEAATEQTGSSIGYFGFSLIGVPLVVVTLVVIALVGDRLIPRRESQSLPEDFSRYQRDVVEHYELSGLATTGVRTFRLHVEPASTLVGKTVRAAITDDAIDTVAAQSERGRVLSSTHRLEPSDVLVVSGVGTAVEALAREADLTVEDTIGRRMSGQRDSLINRDNGICELVIPPRSSWIGRPAFGGMVRAEDGLLVLSVRRQNDDVSSRASTLQEGDALLVYGPWGALDALADDKDVLVVASSETVRRQTVPLGRSAPRAAVILVVTIALLASGAVPPVVAGLLGAGAMVLFRVLSSEQAYRAVPWATLVLIAALIPMSAAITSSGGAELIARPIVDLVSGHSAYLLLAMLFVLTAVLGQFISNVATALIVIPIALVAAADVGVDARTVLMVVCVAAAASLLTPIATPANMIVMNPGGYRFGDYWRLGIVLMVCWLVVTVTLVPVFWPING